MNIYSYLTLLGMTQIHLNHRGQVTNICVGKLAHHWFMPWRHLGAVVATGPSLWQNRTTIKHSGRDFFVVIQDKIKETITRKIEGFVPDKTSP